MNPEHDLRVNARRCKTLAKFDGSILQAGDVVSGYYVFSKGRHYVVSEEDAWTEVDPASVEMEHPVKESEL